MPEEPLALSTIPPAPPVETDYDAICSAVTATERGRWFLDEYARRNRHSDTSQVLAAIARMQAAVVGERAQQASQEASQQVRIELLEMARAIAQARAQLGESGPEAQRLAAEPAGAAAAPDIAGAAERLRQIAWTMRACGIDLAASDQVGQIAETILAADSLRSLGNQRAHKLTEALQYLEHRIDRMLDSHLAAAAAAAEAEPAPEAPSPKANGHDRDPAPEAVALMDAAAAAETEPVPASIAEEAALATAAAAAEIPMDDDVVLTVTDSAVESEPPPMPFVTSAPEPARDSAEPAPPADFGELEPLVVVPAGMPSDSAVDGPEPPFELAAMAVPLEGAASDAEDETETGFSGLEHEPLVVATEPQPEPHPVAAEQAPDEPDLGANDLGANDLGANDLGANDLGANDDLPLTLAPDAAAAEPIAIQVDHDLKDLTDIAADDSAHDVAAIEPLPARAIVDEHPAEDAAPWMWEEPARANTVRVDDPADFLLETPPDHAPPPVPDASTQLANAQLSNALLAIETELLAGITAPDAHANSPPSMATADDASPAPAPAAMPQSANAAAKPTPPTVTDGPLAALMAMSEEERIALFS